MTFQRRGITSSVSVTSSPSFDSFAEPQDGQHAARPGHGFLGQKLILGRGRFQLFELKLHLLQQPRLALRAGAVKLAPQLLDLELEVADECFRARQVRLGIGRFGTGIGELGLRLSAGGALGLDKVEDADVDGWRWMYEANVLGVVRVTKALLPGIRRRGQGHLVLLGSIAGFEVYPGGGGYTAVKHAVNALARTLRLELNGEPIRITEVAPGMVETPFSTVRFGGDAERAAAVYQGVTPLSAQDIAEIVAFAVTRPAHVDLDQIVVRPVAQAAAYLVHRQP